MDIVFYRYIYMDIVFHRYSSIYIEGKYPSIMKPVYCRENQQSEG